MRQLGSLGLLGLVVMGGACAPSVEVGDRPLLGRHASALSKVTTNDPYFADQWQLQHDAPFMTADGKGKIVGSDHAHIADAWALIIDLGLASSVTEIGKDVRLAVIDDGFDLEHEEIKSKVVASKNFGDAVEPGNMFRNTTPSNWHGMMVTGIAAALGDNGKGMAGACPGCELVLARIAADAGASQSIKVDDYYDSVFDWVLAQDADVVNASWGPERTADVKRMQAILDRANGDGRGGLGTSLVFASGNAGEDFGWNHFADSDDTLSVGGSDSTGTRFDFSNFGAGLDLLAPTSAGEKQSNGLSNTYIDRIWSTDNYLKPACLKAGQTPSSGCSDTAGWNPTKPAAGGDGWVGMYSYRFSLTSAAAPLVSGIVGLMLHTNPMLKSDEVRAILHATADKVSLSAAAYDKDGFSTHYGYGRVNALRAVAFAHLYGGGEISDGLRADIDERSPCTRTDCWDLSGAPAAPAPPSDDADGGSANAGGNSATGGGGGTAGTGESGATAGMGAGATAAGDDMGGAQGVNGAVEDSKGGGCSIALHSARAPAVAWFALAGLGLVACRRRLRPL